MLPDAHYTDGHDEVIRTFARTGTSIVDARAIAHTRVKAHFAVSKGRALISRASFDLDDTGHI